MLYTSAKGGFKRFTLRVKAGQSRTVRLTKQKNLAAAANGAKVIDATEGSLNTAHLIDGKEATNWGAVTATNVDESKPYVSVDLAKGTHTIRRVPVSALLPPAPPAARPSSRHALFYLNMKTAFEILNSLVGLGVLY